jgi:hypothetical protein
MSTSTPDKNKVRPPSAVKSIGGDDSSRIPIATALPLAKPVTASMTYSGSAVIASAKVISTECSAGGGAVPVPTSPYRTTVDPRLLSVNSTTNTQKKFVVQLAILMDVTRSMEPARDAVLATIARFIDKTVDVFFPKVGIEVGFVGYRDLEDGKDQFILIPFIDILEDETKLPYFLDKIKEVKCTGGADLPENVLGGMDYALKHLFKIDSNGLPRSNPDCKLIPVLFHFGDAPHHGKLFCDPSIKDEFPTYENLPRPYTEIIDDFANNKIDYYFSSLRSPPGSVDGPILTTKMAELFKQCYDDNQRMKNPFQILDFTTLDVDHVFRGIVAGLNRSVTSYMKKV